MADLTDAIVAHWCASRIAGIEGTGPARLYSSWRALAGHDPDLRRWLGRQGATQIDRLPASAAEAVQFSLDELGIGAEQALAYLEAQIARLPGWASALARRAERGHRGDLVEFVALRLAVEWVLGRAEGALPTFSQPEGPPLTEIDRTDRSAVWQSAAELAYADELLGGLAARPTLASPAASPDAQVVLCIDVRSEGLRRHIEAAGSYETLGFAGFFGLPIALQTADHTQPVPHCPVIVDPRATIAEDEREHASPADRHRLHRDFSAAKSAGASGYVLADASGWVLGLRSLAMSLAPRLTTRAGRALRARRSSATRPGLHIDADAGAPAGTGLTVDQQVGLALSSLTTMGLTHAFAPIVVLCGHRSDNRNNPFRSSLHCGACGGNPGGSNARVLAAICNRPEVRARLAEVGIEIGDDTWFVPAEHETTDDVVTLLDTDAVPEAFTDRVEALAADLARAGATACAERVARLPGSPVPAGNPTRADDPAQIVPEWGLVRNAAIVVGPRSLTAHLDLDRRVFLHSYEATDDPDHTVLETIMTGPVVVAHWISAQYYFSTVDPVRFGAGSKPFHNVIGRLGVSEGTSTDLRTGLPLESVWFDGQPVHDPLRLLVVIEAPVDDVDEVITHNPVLRRLFDNGWARVVARPSGAGEGFVIRQRNGAWEPWDHADADPPSPATPIDLGVEQGAHP